MKPIDITGKKFNRLTAIRLHHIEKYNHGTRHFWEFQCDCGKIIILNKSNVTDGHTQSCGCYHSQKTKECNIKHGMSYSRIYHIWIGMIERCYNHNNPAYIYYGERGIKICSEWKRNFDLFYKWSIENGYSDNLTIDRIDVNGNYEPSNCRWVDYRTQLRNTRRNKIITYKGISHCVSEWAEIFSINVKLLESRLKRGWNFEKAILKSPEDYKKRSEKLIEFRGEKKTKREWCKCLCIHPTTLYRWIKKEKSITAQKTESMNRYV